MATNRESALRRAEKLLKQGRLEAAIAEYVQAVDEQPRDWATVNVLGDLYAKAGQIENAAQQYLRVADHFAREGFLQKAAALYKKVVKIKPQDEQVLLQLAELSEQQGLVADAKSCLSTVAECRRRRGDRRGSAEAILRLAGLDPADIKAALLAARASAELGDAGGAAERFRYVGVELLRRGRKSDGLKALQDGVAACPTDDALRATLVQAALDAGQAKLARRYMTTEETPRATEVTTAPHASPDADPPLLRAEHELRAGRVAEGRGILSELLADHAASRTAVFALGHALTDVDADAAFACLELASDAAVVENDFKTATSALRTFIDHVPDHVPALMKLIEISVDGGLDAMTFATQAQLADAFLATGRAAEARVIAEDLVAREPAKPANVDRLRRVLVEVGETDPEHIIAGYLTGESPSALAVLWDGAGAQTPTRPGPVLPVEPAVVLSVFPAGQPTPELAPEPVADATDVIELAEDEEIELDFRSDAESEPAVVADGEVERVIDEWLKRQPPASPAAAPPPVPADAESPSDTGSAVAEAAAVEPPPVIELTVSDAEFAAPVVEEPVVVFDEPEAAVEQAVRESAVPMSVVEEPVVAPEKPVSVVGQPVLEPEMPAAPLAEPDAQSLVILAAPAPSLIESRPAMVSEPPTVPGGQAEPSDVREPAEARDGEYTGAIAAPVDSELPASEPAESTPEIHVAESEPGTEPTPLLVEQPAWGWAAPEPAGDATSDIEVEPLPPPVVVESLEALADLGAEPPYADIPVTEIPDAALATAEVTATELSPPDFDDAVAEPEQPPERPVLSASESAEVFAALLEPTVLTDTAGRDGSSAGAEPEEASEAPVAEAEAAVVSEAELSAAMSEETTLEIAPAEPTADTEGAVVDLSVAIGELRAGVQPSDVEEEVVGETATPLETDDLDRVFKMFRDEAALRGLADTSEQHLKLAAAYRDIGMIDECLGALEVAARSPRHRFEAASLLAETLRGEGRTREAVEWFERAAEAPAPSAEAGRGLLYELAATLSAVGETERALAVFLELQADAPDYRDVAARVRRLSSVT